MLPKDSVILLSYINTKLRDEYSSFDKLCDELGYDKNYIENELKKINYEYSMEYNQFK